MLLTLRCSLHLSSEMQATLFFHSYFDLNLYYFYQRSYIVVDYTIGILHIRCHCGMGQYSMLQSNRQHLRRPHSRPWTNTRCLYAVNSFHCNP